MKNYIKKLENAGIILKGHFKLSSGQHSNRYINKDEIFSNRDLYHDTIDYLVDLIDENFSANEYDSITGPAIAGICLASSLSLALYIKFAYPEKNINLHYKEDDNGVFFDHKTMIFRRGYDKALKDSKVLIVEDIITSGKSVQRTIDAVHKCEAVVVGVISIWNRTDWNTNECKVLSLINETVESWEPEECPLCKEGIELQDPKNL